MTTKQVLASNSYIQFPKFLGFYIGVNEAVLLSALCDKDSWCEYNIANYDGCFYYLRDEIELDTGLSESQQRTALKSLSDLHIISTKRAGIPSKVYYKINVDELENVISLAYSEYKVHKIQWSQNMTTSGIENMTTCDIENRISTIDKNINIKINNKSTVSGAHSKNRSKVYKQRNILEDTLESGKEIDEQKKKKSPKEKFVDECLDIIDKEYSDSTKELLIEYFNFVSAVPENKDNLCKRVKTVKAWRHKLDRLEELIKDGYDANKLIMQSLDKQQYVFYPLQSNTDRNHKHECFSESIISTPIEEARQAMADKKAKGVKVY